MIIFLKKYLIIKNSKEATQTNKQKALLGSMYEYYIFTPDYNF